MAKLLQIDPQSAIGDRRSRWTQRTMEQETMIRQFQQPRSRRHSTRRGFTMIELLVTIGIIMVLIGIVIVGVKHMTGSSKTSATKIDLQNVHSMLAELELAGPLTTTLLPVNPTGAMGAPMDVTFETYDATNNGTPVGSAALDRWLSPAVLQTQTVMGRIRSVPKNRTALQSMPGERLMKAQVGGKDYSTATSTPGINTTANQQHGTPDPAIVVDAWNNPIIFVPGGGLVPPTYVSGIFYKKGATVTTGTAPNLTFFRTLKEGKLGSPAAGPDWESVQGSYAVVVAPGNRPYFASAGPDGDFSTLDDNMYSFDQ
jgi:type II secretory pathway pseudopilin PulG